MRGWNALVGSVHRDGKLVHVQPIGETPKHFDEDNTDVYGVGAALYEGRVDFSADIVMVDGKPQAKAGSLLRENPRLVRVM